MADQVQVSCHKPDNADADRRIQGIGGVNPNGTRWYLSIDDAIKGIQDGKWDFYVDVQGRRVRVIIGKHTQTGRLYLTTEGDGFPPNNLLKLPVCP
jgi:hypothetical protein